MSRLTLAAYDKLCQDISTLIEKTGYVPPVRVLADQFECSPVTAWRIVRSQGWIAKGHHWEEVQQGKKKKVAG
jgi:DNA-binding GntR family transcriptional regulator